MSKGSGCWALGYATKSKDSCIFCQIISCLHHLSTTKKLQIFHKGRREKKKNETDNFTRDCKSYMHIQHEQQLTIGKHQVMVYGPWNIIFDI